MKMLNLLKQIMQMSIFEKLLYDFLNNQRTGGKNQLSLALIIGPS